MGALRQAALLLCNSKDLLLLYLSSYQMTLGANMAPETNRLSVEQSNALQRVLYNAGKVASPQCAARGWGAGIDCCTDQQPEVLTGVANLFRHDEYHDLVNAEKVSQTMQTSSTTIPILLVQFLSTTALLWYVLRFPDLRRAQKGTVGYHVAWQRAKKSVGFKRRVLVVLFVQVMLCCVGIFMTDGAGHLPDEERKAHQWEQRKKVAKALTFSFLTGLIGIVGLYTPPRLMLTYSGHAKAVTLQHRSWLSTSEAILEEFEDAMLLYHQKGAEHESALENLVIGYAASDLAALCSGDGAAVDADAEMKTTDGEKHGFHDKVSPVVGARVLV
jgi:hypothetical protein